MDHEVTCLYISTFVAGGNTVSRHGYGTINCSLLTSGKSYRAIINVLHLADDAKQTFMMHSVRRCERNCRQSVLVN